MVITEGHVEREWREKKESLKKGVDGVEAAMTEKGGRGERDREREREREDISSY